ncbi:methyl-accepting chemotaxis protein [Soehngenia longivitae]|uniref:Methyl-accepting chemotaxis protein n=1 Tax=Soehngenia longivitae TaxID=2562294 RepID=A0A4Z0D5J8_9FIRM|nr:methyl-accepting chemotaxis protein [Soehngenia longivitae]TFZ39893.1 methyl-accepting chemotaxis protein [Soehngenia longivitae]
MQIFNKSIRKKITSGFLLITLLTMILGSLAIWSILEVQKNDDKLYKENTVPLGELVMIVESYLSMQSEIKDVLIVGQMAVIDEASIEKKNSQFDKLLENYSKAASDPKEKEIINALKSYKTEYDELMGKVISLSKANKPNEARVLMYGQGGELNKKITDAYTKLMTINVNEARLTSESNAKYAQRDLLLTVVLLALSIVCSVVFGSKISNDITKPIKELENASSLMAEGDFGFQLNIDYGNRKDEIANLARNFSKMFEKISSLLKEFETAVEETTTSSDELTNEIALVSEQGININNSVNQIAAGMQETSASVEQVASSSETIATKAKELVSKALIGEEKGEEIENRAKEMKDSAVKSKKNAREIYLDKQNSIKKSIEEVKIVEEIEKMTDVISEIAGQTDLLALNAAIEAARAGEAGRGFSVVADEIRKLAEHSEEATSKIKQLIAKVNQSVDSLSTSAREILRFIDEDVTNDYDKLESTGNLYFEDALFVKELTRDFSLATSEISVSVDEIGSSIESVAAVIEESNAAAQEISLGSDETSRSLVEIANKAKEQKELAKRLREILGQFKI